MTRNENLLSFFRHKTYQPPSLSDICSHFSTFLLLLWRICPTPEAHRCTHTTGLPQLNPMPPPGHLNPSLWNDHPSPLSCISPISIQTSVQLQKRTDTHSLISDAPYIKAKLISLFFLSHGLQTVIIPISHPGLLVSRLIT